MPTGHRHFVKFLRILCISRLTCPGYTNWPYHTHLRHQEGEHRLKSLMVWFTLTAICRPTWWLAEAGGRYQSTSHITQWVLTAVGFAAPIRLHCLVANQPRMQASGSADKTRSCITRPSHTLFSVQLIPVRNPAVFPTMQAPPSVWCFTCGLVWPGFV